jgi:hypothetical protein
LSGLTCYSFFFNRISIPITKDPSIIGVSFHVKDAYSPLGQELAGYLQTNEHAAIATARTANPLLIDTKTSIAMPPPADSPTKSIVSVWPMSYISYNNMILPLRMEDYGAQISTHRQKKQEIQEDTDQFSNLNINETALTGFFSKLSISKLAFNKDNQLILSGDGQEHDFIELVSALNRPLLTKTGNLEDGTTITEIRATPHNPAIETTGGISTYSSSQPFFLATHNKDTGFWALRNVPTKSSAPNAQTLDQGICPQGSFGTIDKSDTTFFHEYKFVINILDKITLTKSGVHLCLSVDKL